MYRTLFYLIMCCLPLIGAGQQASKYLPEGLHYNYTNCKFSVSVKDTLSINNKKCVRINAMILNDSPDTLRYGMEDFDFFYFRVISNDFFYTHNEPLRNVFIPVEVLPHKTSVHELLLECRHNRLQGSVSVIFKLLLTHRNEVGDNMVITDEGNIVKLPDDVNERTHYAWSNTITF